MDADSQPVYNVGTINIPADIDTHSVAQMRRDNAQGISLYPGVERDENFGIDSKDLLFSACSRYDTGAPPTLAVLANLAGQGAEAARIFGAREEDAVKAAVENGLQYIGCAWQAENGSTLDQGRGITVQVGGLKTLRVGLGGEGFIKPGDECAAEVMLPSEVMHSMAAGTIPGKITLQLRRVSGKSAARTLHTQIRAFLRHGESWKMALGEHLEGTARWGTAAHHLTSSHLVSMLLGLNVLLKAGIVGVPAGAPEAIKALVRGASDDEAGDRYTEFLADALGLIGSGAARSQLQAIVDAEPVRKPWLNLRATLLNTMFYDGTYNSYEYGHRIIAGVPKLMARANDATRTTLENEPAGQMLQLQLQHVPRAVDAIFTAIENEKRKVVGIATSGGSTAHGSGNVTVNLGKRYL